MIEKIKNWNWSAFFVILLICAIGALGNESTKTYKEFLFIMLIFGLPFGLIWAYLGKKINKMSNIKTHQIRTFEEFGAVINEDNFAILMEQFIGVMEQYTRIKKVAPETIFKGFNWIEDGKTDILNPIINGVKMKDE